MGKGEPLEIQMQEPIRFLRFPLPGINAMTAATSRSFPRHTHDQYGIGVIDCGGHASLSDRRQVEAGPGNLIFVNPGEVHDGRAIGTRSRTWRMLYIDPPLMEELAADCFDGGKASMMFTAAVYVDNLLRKRFDDAFQHAMAPEDTRSIIACETALLRLAAGMVVNSTARSIREQAPSPSVRRARRRIDADPSVRLTLTDLAREAGLSRYQLLRGFARETGLTPHAYILQRRVALARRLIRGGLAAAEVATTAGFFDQSHLNRCFVRQFGVTPIRYASSS